MIVFCGFMQNQTLEKMNGRKIVQWVVGMGNTWGTKWLFLKRKLVAHHKPLKAAINLSLTWMTSSNVM
jgi:hypothetical protein